MVKSELLNTVAERLPTIPARDTEKVVGQIVEIMIDALANGNRIEVRGFGSITLRFRKARNNARNPKNGQIVATLEKWRPHFKAGLKLRKVVNDSLKYTEIKSEKRVQTNSPELVTEEV